LAAWRIIKYLKIDSPARGGGFKAKAIINKLGLLAEHKGILYSKPIDELIDFFLNMLHYLKRDNPCGYLSKLFLSLTVLTSIHNFCIIL